MAPSRSRSSSITGPEPSFELFVALPSADCARGLQRVECRGTEVTCSKRGETHGFFTLIESGHRSAHSRRTQFEHGTEVSDGRAKQHYFVDRISA